MVERSLIACNGIEVIGDCIYETKQIKQQQQQQQQQQKFNATLPYTQSLPRVYGCSSSSFLNFKPPFIRHNFQFLQKFKRMLEKQPRLFLRLYIYILILTRLNSPFSLQIFISIYMAIYHHQRKKQCDNQCDAVFTLLTKASVHGKLSYIPGGKFLKKLWCCVGGRV